MSFSLQEAIYKFEMKGEYEEAIRILKNVIEEGDDEDRESANFYLGKIQELAGNKNAANFFYNQSLNETKETTKAYWLAEREAQTSVSFEKILQDRITLPSSIKQIFNGKSTYILLNNGLIQKIEADTLSTLKNRLPLNTEVLFINDAGVWYQPPERDSLFFKPHNNQNSSKSYPLEGTTSLFAHEDDVIIQSDKVLSLLNKKGVHTQINEKFNGCQIDGFFNPTRHFMLNCPDNAIHFLSPEDGSEAYTISQIDAIQKILVHEKELFLLSSGFLFCYNPKSSSSPLWKVKLSNAEDIVFFNNRIVVMDASGRIFLIDYLTGTIVSTYRSDASSMHTLALGTLGLFTAEGALTVVDTLLVPLWNFNFAKPIIYPPLHGNHLLYLAFDQNHLQPITPRYYGKKPLLVDKLSAQAARQVEFGEWTGLPILLDTIFKLEPGNAKAWLFKALYLEKNNGSDKEKQRAWTEAVRHSISSPNAAPLILNRYSRAINAKFVNILSMSPKTKYPKLFGYKKNLYTVDPAAERLLCINTDTGELRWFKSLPSMDDGTVMAHDESSLAIVSGFSLNVIDLNKDVYHTILQLPGKAFNIALTETDIYISTWNGFFIKVSRNENKQVWSRKVFSTPFLFEKDGDQIHLVNMEGDITHIYDASGLETGSQQKLQTNVTQMALLDSTLAIATGSNKLYLYHTKNHNKSPLQILLENSISSVKMFRHQDKNYIIIGQSDQKVLLYTENGTPLWTFQGKQSVFMEPTINDDKIWIDQGNEVVALALKDGSVVKKFSTPGGAGTPFILNKTLYTASSKRLLYGFSL